MAFNWDAVAKQRYGNYINPLPNDNSVADYIKFIPAEQRPGNQFNFPVQMSLAHGVTHDNTNTAFALSSTIEPVIKNATLDGSTTLIADNVAYDVIAKFMNPGATVDDQKAVDLKIQILMESGEFYREANLLYGPGSSTALANVGVVSASISGANLAAPQVVSITRATWAPGIWNLLSQGMVDVYQSDGTTLRESDVTVSALPSAGGNRVQLTKAASVATVAAGDMILLRGQKGKSCYGLQAILENTGSLFGIDASVYPQWKAKSFNANGALTTSKIRQMASMLYANGLREGGKLFVSGPTFSDLTDELSALINFLQSSGQTAGVKQTGAENIEIKTPSGLIEVAVHTLMKQGIAMFIAKDNGRRVGSTDLTFSLPGTNRWFYVELPSNAGAQFRILGNQAPVLTKPYRCAEITGILNAADSLPA